jgi:predicted MPP superfamily phosphohydrolase
MKITRIQVVIKNLPENWKNKTAVFFSDPHLGQIHGRKFAQKIKDSVDTLRPDIVFIGGDMYDGVKVNALDMVEPFRDLHAPLGTYFIMGNHEEFSDNTVYLTALRTVGIRVLLDEAVVVEGLSIIGVDYKTTTNAENFKTVLEHIQIDSTKPSILLKHTPANVEIAEMYGVSLQLSGHTHQAQVFPWMCITRQMYKGFDYGLHMYKNMQVYTSSGVGTWGPPLRVGTRSEIVHIEFRGA